MARRHQPAGHRSFRAEPRTPVFLHSCAGNVMTAVPATWRCHAGTPSARHAAWQPRAGDPAWLAAHPYGNSSTCSAFENA